MFSFGLFVRMYGISKINYALKLASTFLKNGEVLTEVGRSYTMFLLTGSYGVFRLRNVCAPRHVGVDGGVCTQYNLYRTNHIYINSSGLYLRKHSLFNTR